MKEQPVFLLMRILVGLITILLCLLLVFGCSKGQTKDTASVTVDGKKYDVIRVMGTANSQSDALTTNINWVGEEKGFFEEQGIKLEYVGPIPSPQIVASVIAGKVDVGGLHANRTIAGISAGAKIKAVVAQSETTQAIPHRSYLTRKDSTIYTPKDLVGKKLAISSHGGCHEYIPYGWLHYVGGIDDPRGQIEFVIMPETLMEQALRQGDVDAAAINRLLPAEIPTSEEFKEFRYLFSDYEIWGTVGGATPQYFTEKFIKEKPDVVRRYVTAMANAIHWHNAHPQEAIEITAKRAGLDPKKVRPRYFATDGIIKEDSIQMWIDMLTEFGEIKPGMKPEQIYTNEFNPYYQK